MSESKQEPSFDDTFQKFVDENRLKPTDRELLTHKGLVPESIWASTATMESVIGYAESCRDRAAMAINLLAVRTADRQARSQQNHANAMRWLTVVLILITIVQVFLNVEQLPPLYLSIVGTLILLLVVMILLDRV